MANLEDLFQQVLAQPHRRNSAGLAWVLRTLPGLGAPSGAVLDACEKFWTANLLLLEALVLSSMPPNGLVHQFFFWKDSFVVWSFACVVFLTLTEILHISFSI